MAEFNVPEYWGKDSLTKFIDVATQNMYSVSLHYKVWFDVLVHIDSLFERFTKNNLNPTSFYEPFLLIRAHSSFRAAIRLGLSGQLSEAFSLLRGCLEYGFYAYYFSKRPQEIKTWVERDENEAGKKNARKKLVNKIMIEEVEKADKDLGIALKTLYELTIDVGAHPNRKTITLAMQRTETEDLVTYHQAHLNTDHLMMIFCLKSTIQVGICILKIFRLIFPERFDILGITTEVEKISRTKINGLPL